MAFFFFVSGMLHKYNGEIQINKYLRTLVIPIISFNIIMWILYAPFLESGIIQSSYKGKGLIYTYLTSFVDGFKGLYYSGENYTKMSAGPTWFLVVLFYLKILNDIFNKKWWVCIIMLFVCVAICKIWGNHFFIKNAVCAFPFYVCGFWAKDFVDNLMNKKYKILKALILFFILITITRIQGRVSLLGLMFGNTPRPFNYLLFYVNAFVGTLMMLYISSVFKKNNHITNLAKALISFLGFQCIFNHLVGNIIGYNLEWYYTLLWSICILYICYGLHILVTNYTPWMLGKW